MQRYRDVEALAGARAGAPDGFKVDLHLAVDGEPPLPDDTSGARGWEIYLKGELIATGNL